MADLRIAGFAQGRAKVTILFDGRPVDALEGESIAAALWAAGIRRLRTAPNNGGARGPFCMMGLCQECVVEIDGQVVEACRRTVSDGLKIVSRP
ncbi:(2Fe-2S)-binding protein [Sphingobium subterraneum]|uniref:Putative molibdopterin-dependent oxidoreductase YjgC n=1 Tax=Sphingobium subterraneum TaxID=627688 RepID=A0A841IXQ8_9SPHN|nr:(2Fe-2S)-binding protein [Sphingobium subterraneum]MBB6123407.1 putative molibdopterin-dependent oxidoreductase YjgC [Sphingobium subterraneum]